MPRTPTLREADLSLPGLLRQLGTIQPGPLPWRSVPVAHNTWARFAGTSERPAVEVVLHSTVIARFTRIASLAVEDVGIPDLWLLTLSTGGWDTVTTRDRLNRVLRPLGLNVSRGAGTTWVHEVGVELADGRHVLGDRRLAAHDGHALPVATVLEDGTRVVHPALAGADLFRLLARGVSCAALTAAAPETAA